MESRKMVLKNLFTGQQWRKTQEQTYGHGERVRCMERVTWKLTLPYVKQIANGNLLYGSGNSTGAVYQPRGVGWGERWGEVQKRGDICIPLANSC